MNATMWDEADALESQMAIWFPSGIQNAETAAGSAVTEEFLDAALAVLLERTDR